MDISINTLIIILIGVITLTVIGGIVTGQTSGFQDFISGQLESVNLIPGG